MDLDDLKPVAILLLVTVIVISMGAKIMSEISDDMDYAIERTVSAYDTDKTLDNATAMTLTYQNLTVGSVVIRNISSNNLVHSGNYTVSPIVGTIIGSGTISANMNATLVNVSYTYKVYDTTPKDSVRNGSKALGTFAKWTPTVALVAIAAIILGLVAAGLYFGTKD